MLLQNIIQTGMDLIMPLKGIKINCDNPPWFTVEFKKLIKYRQRAFANSGITRYRHYRKQVNRERKRLRSKYFLLKVNHLKTPNRLPGGMKLRKYLVCNTRQSQKISLHKYTFSMSIHGKPLIGC